MDDDDDDDEMEEGDYIANPFISLSYYLCCSIYKKARVFGCLFYRVIHSVLRPSRLLCCCSFSFVLFVSL